MAAQTARENKGLRPESAAAPKGGDTFSVHSFTFANATANSPDAISVHLGLYKGYVEQANKVVAALGDKPALAGADSAIHARESLSRRFAFESNGVRLHQWFFEQLDGSPSAKSPSSGSIANDVMNRSFGGFDDWLTDIKTLSETRGSGWVLTLWDESIGLLSNSWVDLHHLTVPVGQRVVFALDLWEHAYWHDYGAKGRSTYVANVLRDTDWAVIERRFIAAI